MAAEVNDHLLRAAAQILRPLVQQLLASGTPFGRLEARLRELFVEVANTDFALSGHRQTDSRIALLTGINRKEVRRIRSGARERNAPKSFSLNQAAILISRWITDPRLEMRSGRPRPLPYQATRGPSFVKLARRVTADLAPKVILDELLRSGAAEMRAGNMVALKRDSFVPPAGSPQKIEILGEDAPEFIETILHNILAAEDDLLLQRKVFFDNLGRDGTARVRAQMRREGERFLRRVNQLLSKHDRDRNPEAAGGDRYYAGVGVYFFESPRTLAKRIPPGKHSRRTPKE